MICRSMLPVYVARNWNLDEGEYGLGVCYSNVMVVYTEVTGENRCCSYYLLKNR